VRIGLLKGAALPRLAAMKFNESTKACLFVLDFLALGESGW
jgi:hypothetical protein